MILKITTWISRLLFGVVFIFAGFTKAIDPLGSTYKFEDYFLAFNADWMLALAFPMAFVLNVLELVIGFTVLLGIKMRLSAWGALLFMAFFTPLTFYIALTDPVPDCGCFGDAIIISNWDTFYKNIVILAAAIVLFIQRKKIPPLWSPFKDWIIVGVITFAVTALSVYCLRNLPVIDFRPWKIGNNVRELMVPTEEVADTYLIYKNSETGEKKEYPSDDFPWDDEQWLAKWEFVETRREIIQPYLEAPIADFEILDSEGFDFMESYIYYPDFLFIVAAHDLNTTHEKAFSDKINPFSRQAQKAGKSFILLTGSSFQNIEAFISAYDIQYNIYQTDAITLKTIIRSNPGLLLMKDGVVKAKWHHRNIPEFAKVAEKYFPK